MINSDGIIPEFTNKRALIFDDDRIVVVHGAVDVQISGEQQTNEIDLNHVPDDQFREMMKAPDDFKGEILQGNQ